MTKNLRRKLLRDIQQNFVQFMAIFVMCFLSMFVMQAFDSDIAGMGNATDEYLKDTNFMDMCITSSGFSTADLETVKAVEGVKAAELRATYNGRVRLGTQEKKIEFNFIEENNISKMLITEGEAFAGGTYGIWIDHEFAKMQGISVGDVLTLTLDGVTFSEPVKGLMRNPDHVIFTIDETYTDPEIGAYGYAFLDAAEYPGNRLVYDKIFVDAGNVSRQFFINDEDKEELEYLRASLKSVLNVNHLEFIQKQNATGFSSIASDLESDKTMGTVFPAIFIMIALLGIMTTMTRLVTKQRTVIGTLKAIGFGQGAIYAHYIAYPVVISLAGSIAGAVTGWYTLGSYLHVEMNKYYTNPYSRMEVSYRIVLTMIFISAAAALTDYLSCRKILSQHASTILKAETPPVVGAGLLEKTLLWNRLSFATRWNLRDINRNRLRTMSAIFGITLCAMLLLNAFGANEIQKSTEHWEYDELIPAEYTIGFEEGTDYMTVYDYSRQFAGQMVMGFQTELYGDDGFELLNITVVDDGNLYRFQNSKGEYMNLPKSGVAISSKAATILGIEPGDYVGFKMPGIDKMYEGRVLSVYKNPGTQGIAMTREYFEHMDIDFRPNVIYTNMTVPESYVDSRSEVTSVFSKERYIESLRANSETMSIEVTYIMVVAIIIGVVVMYNLGVLSFIEKTREIATLKVLGFPTNKIRWILQQQNILITGMGTALGILVGYRTLGFIMEQLDAESDFIIRLSIVPPLIAFLLTFVLSLAVNAAISSKVSDINMVEALKGVE